MGAGTQTPESYHWCIWYYYQSFDELNLTQRLSGLKQIKPSIPIQTIQIDAGYFAKPGDWLEPTRRFSHGIKAAFRQIIDAGYRAGVWIGPFMVGNRSRLYREHPDWVVHLPDGTPRAEWKFSGKSRTWGYPDEE